MKESLIKLLAAVVVNLAALSVIGACARGKFERDPMSLYDKGKDALALKYAEDGLNGKHDFFDRLFVVQYYLARYLETGDEEHAAKITTHYQGVNSLQRLPKSDPGFEEYLWLAKYLDSAILTHIKKDKKAARLLLDSYCPQLNYTKKTQCHIENIEYFLTDFGYGRDRHKGEIMFIISLTIGDVYHDSDFVGNALWSQAHYDLAQAEKRARTYASRNEWNDKVLKMYCVALYDQRQRGHADYVAAFGRSNCQTYLGEKAVPAPIAQ